MPDEEKAHVLYEDALQLLVYRQALELFSKRSFSA